MERKKVLTKRRNEINLSKKDEILSKWNLNGFVVYYVAFRTCSIHQRIETEKPIKKVETLLISSCII
jgi:hypothetical protein